MYCKTSLVTSPFAHCLHRLTHTDLLSYNWVPCALCGWFGLRQESMASAPIYADKLCLQLLNPCQHVSPISMQVTFLKLCKMLGQAVLGGLDGTKGRLNGIQGYITITA